MPTMKTLKRLSHLLLFGACVTLARAAHAAPSLIDGTVFTDPSLAYSTSPIFDVSHVENLSMQITASSAPTTAISVTDGVKSTSTIVVLSTSGLTGARIGFRGTTQGGTAFNCSFTNGQEFTSVSTTSGTAKAISDALLASGCLSNIFVSTWSSSTVYSTASVVGTAANSWTAYSSTPTALQVNAFSNGADSAFNLTTDKVTTSAAHGISTGLPLLFVTVTGTAPTGLTTATTYYAIVTSPVEFKLALTSTGSLAGSAIDITAVTGSGSFTFTPTAYAGTYSWKWQGSNDGINFADLSVSSVTYSAAVTTLWTGLQGYKFLRLPFTTGTGGGMNIKVVGYGWGKESD